MTDKAVSALSWVGATVTKGAARALEHGTGHHLPGGQRIVVDPKSRQTLGRHPFGGAGLCQTKLAFYLHKYVRPEGLEPPTLGLEGRQAMCSGEPG